MGENNSGIWTLVILLILGITIFILIKTGTLQGWLENIGFFKEKAVEATECVSDLCLP
mgnify:CR=1 FL=1